MDEICVSMKFRNKNYTCNLYTGHEQMRVYVNKPSDESLTDQSPWIRRNKYVERDGERIHVVCVCAGLKFTLSNRLYDNGDIILKGIISCFAQASRGTNTGKLSRTQCHLDCTAHKPWATQSCYKILVCITTSFVIFFYRWTR